MLILGAGASIPFGFPTGRELKEEIVRLKNDYQPFIQHLISAGFNREDIYSFSDTLKSSLAPSVDRFLEFSVNFQPEYRRLGCAAIAANLLIRSQSLGRNGDHDWLELLFSALHPQFDEGLDEDKLTVVTFNYDCSFEYYLYNGLLNTIGPKRTENTLAKIKIIYLHGRLNPSVEAWRAVPISKEAIEDSINPEKGIKIIHEQNPHMPAFSDARVAIQNAQRICFLGFGYDETNLSRLLQGQNSDVMRRKTIFGSAFGRTNMENVNVNSTIFMDMCRFGQNHWKISEFLRESGIFSQMCHLPELRM